MLFHIVRFFNLLLYVVVLCGLTSCQNDNSGSSLFELLSPEQTGIQFINELDEQPGNNILESEFFYNGGGLTVGDVNNDDRPDIYFTANQGANALYLNLGNFQFKEITSVSGVEDETGWSAGAAMVDINSDGLLDLYVCKAGNLDKEERRNKLFINKGLSKEEQQIPSFTEQAAAYNIDDTGYCTQPVFFDYNRDGLLDLFIVNYNTRYFSGFDIRTIRNENDEHAGDKLYRNNGNGTFTDVSEQAGILQNPIGFGLSATVSDLNNDGWPDIYVTNDFIERDYMYINQGNGTFSEQITARTDVTSYFSMGSDIADINNDGLPDILVVDMLPPDRSRREVFKTPNYDIYEELVANGYHRKNMRNTLQFNNGYGRFTEVGQLAGISMTDWSWAPLMADFDNDGYKDIFITNGFPRFYTNLDYLNDVLWEQFPDENLPDDPERVYELVEQMDEVKMHNYMFRNREELAFKNVTEKWGLNQYAVSGAASYVDLNNDGALDLVVNNINEPPFVFRNRVLEQNDNNYLKVRLKESDSNIHDSGAKITLTGQDSSLYFQEAYRTRGFQSTVDPVLHFGLGDEEQVDIKVIWPDEFEQTLTGVSVNQTITIRRQKTEDTESTSSEDEFMPPFNLLSNSVMGLDFIHEGNFFRDKVTNPLMPHTLSNLGPALARGDANHDGLTDLFVGGGEDQPPVLYLQQTDGTFNRAAVPVFEDHSEYVDVDALFFDANGNGYTDLYVVSGGNFDPTNGPIYQDRLYLNDGFGNFAYSKDALPTMETSGGSVTLLDIEGDGDMDLFVGGRVRTGRYPVVPRSYLLKNDNGKFRDITKQASPELMNPGMVNDAAWADIDNDQLEDIIIVGEWMPVRIFKNRGDQTFREITQKVGLNKTSGWWNALEIADLNADGRLDLIAGNRGLNTSLRATPDKPVILYADDFDGNGSIDPVMTEVIDGERYPVAGKDLLFQQLPGLRDKYSSYASYATATAEEILSVSKMKKASKFYAHTFASTVFVNKKDGTFEQKPLPATAQVAPIFDMLVADFFDDGTADILIAGNNFGTRPEIGPLAGQGVVLRGREDFNFTPILPRESGFWAGEDVRKVELLSTRRGPIVVLGRYNNSLITYGYINSNSE